MKSCTLSHVTRLGGRAVHLSVAMDMSFVVLLVSLSGAARPLSSHVSLCRLSPSLCDSAPLFLRNLTQTPYQNIKTSMQSAHAPHPRSGRLAFAFAIVQRSCCVETSRRRLKVRALLIG